MCEGALRLLCVVPWLRLLLSCLSWLSFSPHQLPWAPLLGLALWEKLRLQMKRDGPGGRLMGHGAAQAQALQ